MSFRIGLGEDAHLFQEKSKKPLILAGITIPHNQGIKANSDGDVILHALCNAYEVVSSTGSLSCYADEICKAGTQESTAYLKHAQDKAKSWQPISISISLEAKAPKLEPHLPQIKKSLAKKLNLPVSAIGLTCTTGETREAKSIKATAIVLFQSLK